jgi:NAD+ diphosphatase
MESMHMTLAFVANPLDRRANHRGDAAWLAGQLASPSARLVQVAGDSALVADGLLLTDAGDPHDALDASGVIFLGLDGEGAPWFARERRVDENSGEISGEALRGQLRDLRGLALAEALPPEQLGIVAQARALLHWHARHRFCATCGAATELAEAGYRRHCAGCNADHFPRTDPVAIIAVHHQGSVLLGRQRSWRPGMYSALAGFLEPGETIEAAARREVFEEAGVVVGDVRYVASQPWPFPGSLMIGLIGEAVSTEIAIDEKELEDARWFGAEEARSMVERRHPQGLFAANPMAIAHHLVRTALGLPAS